jgi:hypothetical protein
MAGNEPDVADPYEAKMVYVDQSGVEGAGEGLFANVDVPARSQFHSSILSTVISFSTRITEYSPFIRLSSSLLSQIIRTYFLLLFTLLGRLLVISLSFYYPLFLGR